MVEIFIWMVLHVVQISDNQNLQMIHWIVFCGFLYEAFLDVSPPSFTLIILSKKFISIILNTFLEYYFLEYHSRIKMLYTSIGAQDPSR